jgi:hypothetical protein
LTQHPKVLLLITDAGGGHRSSAVSLQAAAQALNAPLDLRIVNVYREIWQDAEPLGRLTGIYGEDLYNAVLKRSWLALAPAMRVGAHFAAKRPNPRALRDGVAYLRREQPAFCVSLMPFVNDLHTRICAEAGVPLGLVVTDLVDTRPYMWYTPGVCADAAWVNAPCAEAHQQAQEAGAKRIVDSGLLLHPKYMDPSLRAMPRREARLALGLDPDKLTVLVSMGGFGGKTMEDLVAGLEKVGQDWQVVAICGKSEALRQRLERRPPSRHKLVAVGFTDKFQAYLRAADLMVGKPGPASLFEAIAAGTPLVLDAAAAMPQEEPNAGLAERHGMAVKVGQRRHLPAAVAALALDAPRREAMIAAQQAYRLPDAGKVLVEAILESVQAGSKAA